MANYIRSSPYNAKIYCNSLLYYIYLQDNLVNRLEFSRSEIVIPSRNPWSRSAQRTQLRKVSAEQPIFSATKFSAAHCESYSNLVLEYNSHHRPIPYLQGAACCLIRHSANLRNGVSGKAGAIHSTSFRILMICDYVYRVFFIAALLCIILCRRILIVSGIILRKGYMSTSIFRGDYL